MKATLRNVSTYFRIQCAADSLLGLKIGRTQVKSSESIEHDVVVGTVPSDRLTALGTAHSTDKFRA
jgi:hypothetical protein